MSSSSILFIDSCVTGYQTLIDSLTEPLEVFILDGESDGLLQIAAHLQGRSGIDAIHVVSHGRQGALYLGNTLLDDASIASYAGQLAEIGKALTDAGDILLYGCDVALGDVGLHFISSLAQFSGADVAASNNTTGTVLLGGDWVLEARVGLIGGHSILALEYSALLSADIVAPTLTSLTLPTTIDLSAGATSATFAAQAQDNDGGTGVDNVTLFLDHSIYRGFVASNFAIGGSFGSGSDTFVDGTPTTANTSFSLSTLTNSGVYNVTQAWVTDLSGNRTIYSAAQLLSLGVNTSFTVIGGAVPDIVAPTLTSLTLPTTIDLSAGATSATFAAQAQDNDGGTGVDNVTLFLDHSIYRGFVASNFAIGGSFGSGSDTFVDGTPTTANTSFSLSTLTNSGVYNVTQAWVTDLSGNRTIYSAAQLLSLGVNTSFTVTDGIFVPNALTATEATDQGKLVLSFSTAQLGTAIDNLKLTLSYDSSMFHFESWRSGASGNYAVSSTVSEVGGSGSVTLSASISNGGDNSDFIQMLFTTSAHQGDFAYGYTSASVNSESVANTFASYHFQMPNLPPSGLVTISGAATQGQTLTAANTLTDLDGLGTIGYQWSASGVAMTGETSSTLVLTPSDVGKTITVTASYVDGYGSDECVTSSGILVMLGKTVDLLAYSWKAHTLLSDVSLNAVDINHSGVTSASGAASFITVTDASLSLSATRTDPAIEAAPTSAAVNLQDAIAILKMIVGLSVNGSNQALSPYQALAADYDGNGTVQLSDAIGVLKHVVGLSAPDPTWYFVNEIDTSVPGKANLSPGLPQTTLTVDLSGQSPVHVGLVGYLSGDVDGSFAGASGASDLDVTQPDYIIGLVGLHAELSLAQFGM